MSEEELNLDIMKECKTCLVLLTENYVKNESVWYQAIEADRSGMYLVYFIEKGIIIPERLLAHGSYNITIVFSSQKSISKINSVKS